MGRFHGGFAAKIQRLGTLDFEESLPRQGKTEIRFLHLDGPPIRLFVILFSTLTAAGKTGTMVIEQLSRSLSSTF